MSGEPTLVERLRAAAEAIAQSLLNGEHGWACDEAADRIEELEREPPTPYTHAQIREALGRSCVGACECLTKTPEPQHHALTCRYRILRWLVGRYEEER